MSKSPAQTTPKRCPVCGEIPKAWNGELIHYCSPQNLVKHVGAGGNGGGRSMSTVSSQTTEKPRLFGNWRNIVPMPIEDGSSLRRFRIEDLGVETDYVIYRGIKIAAQPIEVEPGHWVLEFQLPADVDIMSVTRDIAQEEQNE